MLPLWFGLTKKGPFNLQNSLAACSLCTSRRNNRPLLDWFTEIQKHGRPLLDLGRKRGELDAKVTRSPFGQAVNGRILELIAADPLKDKLLRVFSPTKNIRGISKLEFGEKSIQFLSKKMFEKLKFRAIKAKDFPRIKRTNLWNTRKYRSRLGESQNWRCAYCACEMQPFDRYDFGTFASIEHVEPLRMGGSHSLANLVVACLYCNSIRDRLNLDAVEFWKLWQTQPDRMTQEKQAHLAKRKQRRPKNKNYEKSWRTIGF